MITVAGFNTAIDRQVHLSEPLVPGAVQRASHAVAAPGGKGLHVAQMIVELGEPAELVGLTDASHRQLLADHLKARGVTWHALESTHELRQCLAVHEADGSVTEILESGAPLDAEVREALMNAVLERLAESSALVLSGSLPRGFDEDAYAQLVHSAHRHGVPCLVDASDESLWQAINARPWLVKPNADEAACLIGHPVQSMSDVLECLQQLRHRNIERAVVTFGAQGAVAFDGDAMWHVWTDPVQVCNGVGSGDCFMAALAVGAVRDVSLGESLRQAAACGAANAENAESGYASAEQVAAWIGRTHLRRLPEASGTTIASDHHGVEP